MTNNGFEPFALELHQFIPSPDPEKLGLIFGEQAKKKLKVQDDDFVWTCKEILDYAARVSLHAPINPVSFVSHDVLLRPINKTLLLLLLLYIHPFVRFGSLSSSGCQWKYRRKIL